MHGHATRLRTPVGYPGAELEMEPNGFRLSSSGAASACRLHHGHDMQHGTAFG